MDCENHEEKCFNRRLGEIYELIDVLLNDSVDASSEACGCNVSCVDEYGCCCCECNYVEDEDECPDEFCGMFPETCELCDEYDDDDDDEDESVILLDVDISISEIINQFYETLAKFLNEVTKVDHKIKDLVDYESVYESIPPNMRNLKSKLVDAMPDVEDSKDYLEDAYKRAMEHIKKSRKRAAQDKL